MERFPIWPQRERDKIDKVEVPRGPEPGDKPPNIPEPTPQEPPPERPEPETD